MEMKVEYPTFYADMTVAFNQALALENRAERDAKVKELQLHYNAQTWITPVLAEELRRLSPTSADIDTSKNNQRNLSKFKENIAKFCVPGRLFASSTQFSQAMDMVCSKWSCQVSHTNNSIRCHYMQPVSKSKRHPDVSKRRKTRSKLDSDCPFCIRYSLPGFVKSNEDPDWKPRMMYQTRLTTQNLHHTCKLTTESYRNASIKSGTKKSRKGAIKGQTGVTAMNAYNADATLLSILGIDCKKILVVKLGGSSITIHQQQQQGGGVGAAHEAVNDEALEWFSETIRSTISKDFVSTAGCGVGDDDDDDNNGSNKYKRPNNKDRIAANDSDEFVNSEQNPAIIVVHGAAGSLFGLGHHSTAKRYGLEGKNSPPPDGMSLAPELVTGIARTRHSVKQLNNAVVSHLIEKGVNAVAISPCFNVPGLMAHGGDEYNGATLLVQSIRQTLSAGLVPVIHGDVGLYGKYRDPGAGADPSASTTSAHRCDHFQSMSGGILGGDTLVKIIATHPLMDGCISKAVFLTDVDGVFTKDPKLFPEDAVLMRNIFIDPVSGERMNINTNTNVNTNTNEVLSASSGSSSHEHDVVTGGLEAKLGVAGTIAKTGVEVVVAKCGSLGAKHAMSQTVLETNAANAWDNTVIRKYEN